MANRRIYQGQTLYVGPTPSTGIHFTTGTYGNVASQIATVNRVKQLQRVQSFSQESSIPRQDVNQIGELAAIDRVSIEQPTVNASFSYYQSSFYNENQLGFFISSGSAGLVSCLSGILNKVSDDKNYFLEIVREGNDSNSAADTLTNGVLAIGNGFISSYGAQGAVGQFPTVNVSVEGLNMQMDTSSTGQVIPAVFPTDGTTIGGWYYTLPTGVQSDGGNVINANANSISVLRPGDITLNLGTPELGVSFSDLKVQNYNLSFDLSRTNLQKLGSKYAFSKEINFPVSVQLQVTADVGDVQSGNLAVAIANNSNYTPSIRILQPNTQNTAVYYELRGAKLDSQSWSTNIGNNSSVNLTFSAQLGGPQATGVGLFLSGVY